MAERLTRTDPEVERSRTLFVERLTRAVRRAEAAHDEHQTRGTRNYVMQHLIPAILDEGMSITIDENTIEPNEGKEKT